MRYTVRWTETHEYATETFVSLDQLAQWAIDKGLLRHLGTTGPQGPELAELCVALEANPHLRAQLLQLHARESGGVRSTTTSTPPRAEPL